MKAMHKQAKWKVYTFLIALITVGTVAFNVGTSFVSYPTQKHRSVSASINEISQQAMSDGDPAAVFESEQYKSLEATTENVYSTRMGIGSGVLAIILNIAVTVALYRYLRRHAITSRAVGATVFISLAVAVLSMAASFVYSNWFSPMEMNEMLALTLLAALPFAIAFSALFTFLIAKVAEWHYNRSHGFIED
ncbi:MAG: hypothetical protein WBK76_02910 [Candidatus Saccharimonadales bacterium]